MTRTARPMDLPQPDPDALAHSQRLQGRIAAEIDSQHGVIGFDRYMELCLYAPGLGYYMAGSRKFGAEGDFITAPEVSPLFSRCLAMQCLEAFRFLPEPNILEFGAGCGVMAAEILRQLARQEALPERYLILEISPELRQRQQQTIENLPRELAGRVQWLDTLPQQFSGVVLANEVLDALPVQRFHFDGERCLELAVKRGESGFGWASAPPSETLAAGFEGLQQQGIQFPAAYTSEFNGRQHAWLGALTESLQQAVILLTDYGMPQAEYYHPQRSHGTLQCHYRHRSHDDPFFLPGLQDITAHVDFSALAHSAGTFGLDLLGYTTQGNFLLGAGITRMIESDNRSHPLDLAQQVKQLTLPTAMGERFKVLALGLDCPARLSGFSLRDLRHQL